MREVRRGGAGVMVRKSKGRGRGKKRKKKGKKKEKNRERGGQLGEGKKEGGKGRKKEEREGGREKERGKHYLTPTYLSSLLFSERERQKARGRIKCSILAFFIATGCSTVHTVTDT